MTTRDWQTILDYGGPLKEIAWYGNGKDAELVLSLESGRTFKMPVQDLTVSSVSELQVKTTCIDDLNVEVSHSGPGILVRSVLVSFMSGTSEGDEQFRNDLREWLEDGAEDDLEYAVDVAIDLDTAAPPTTR